MSKMAPPGWQGSLGHSEREERVRLNPGRGRTYAQDALGSRWLQAVGVGEPWSLPPVLLHLLGTKRSDCSVGDISADVLLPVA